MVAGRPHRISVPIVAIASLALVLGAEIASRVAPVFVAASGLAILAGAVYAWAKLRRPRGARARFGVLLRVAVIYACGSAYGVVLWSRDDWHMADLAYLLFPVALSAYLFWAAFKARRRASGTDGP